MDIINTKHDVICQAVAEYARSVGCLAKCTTKHDFKKGAKVEDGVVFMANKTVLFDVTGCHTTNPTNVNKSPHKVLKAMETGKHDKYDNHAKAKNAELVPIAFNEYGLLGKEAEDFFVLLANEALVAGGSRVHPVSYIHMSLHEFRTQLGCKLAHLNYSVVHEWARRVRKASYRLC